MYNVFIVDDEPFIIEGLYDIIDWDEVGLAIVGQAQNGQEALKKLESVPVDLLITDISMPIMNGLDLIRSARGLLPELKAVVLSGYDEFAYVKEGLSLGIENYLLKPINLQEFRDTLGAVVEKLNISRTEHKPSPYSEEIMRDHVVHRWLGNQIGPEELAERAELLNLPIGKAFVQAAVLRPEQPGGACPETVRGWMRDRHRPVIFQDLDGDIVLLQGGDNALELAAATEETLGLLMQALPPASGLRLSAGSVEEGAAGASHSYRQAKRTQEYFMMHPERSMLRFAELKLYQSDMESDLSFDWNEFAKLVMTKDKEGMLAGIEAFVRRMGARPGISPDSLRDAAVEWMILLNLQVKEIRHTAEPEFYRKCAAKIRKSGSIGELAEAMKEAAAAAIDLLERDIKSPVVQQVMNVVHKSYSEGLSLKKLGALYNIHPVYLGRLFNKEVNESFTEYLNRYRIEKAKEQLRSTHLKVHEIARNAGYWEIGYFYKQFKKYVGVSPTEYKELL